MKMGGCSLDYLHIIRELRDWRDVYRVLLRSFETCSLHGI